MDSEFRSWWIGKNGAQQWSKALDDEGGALGAIEMIFKAGAATQQARIQAALEVYAGMEGFIPETAAEGYCLRIIEQMNKALLQEPTS